MGYLLRSLGRVACILTQARLRVEVARNGQDMLLVRLTGGKRHVFGGGDDDDDGSRPSSADRMRRWFWIVDLGVVSSRVRACVLCGAVGVGRPRLFAAMWSWCILELENWNGRNERENNESAELGSVS